jgi:hypothetical protein
MSKQRHDLIVAHDKSIRINNSDGIRIAQKDKMIMNLQEQRECKKKQLKQDYKLLKEGVKDNPYLQVAIHEYENYFDIEKQQLNALKKLLKHVTSIEDKRDIKKEISALEKNTL